MKRGGEGSPKWKRNKRLNPRLFFNIHLIYNQKVKTIHRVNSKPLSLSPSFFRNFKIYEPTRHLARDFTYQNLSQRKFLPPVDS